MRSKRRPPLAVISGGEGGAVSTTRTDILNRLARVGAATGALLFDSCRCGPGRIGHCLACRRFGRYYSEVAHRRAAWGGS